MRSSIKKFAPRSGPLYKEPKTSEEKLFEEFERIHNQLTNIANMLERLRKETSYELKQIKKVLKIQ